MYMYSSFGCSPSCLCGRSTSSLDFVSVFTGLGCFVYVVKKRFCVHSSKLNTLPQTIITNTSERPTNARVKISNVTVLCITKAAIC